MPPAAAVEKVLTLALLLVTRKVTSPRCSKPGPVRFAGAVDDAA